MTTKTTLRNTFKATDGMCPSCQRVFADQPWRGIACPGATMMIIPDGRRVDAMRVCRCGCHDHE